MTRQQPTTHGPPRASLSDVGMSRRQFTSRARGGAGERSHALLGDLLGGGQSGGHLTPLRGIHFGQGDLDARATGRIVARVAWEKARDYWHGN